MPNQNIIYITGPTPTPTPMIGSLILNFDELVNDLGVDYISLRVGGLFRYIRYTDVQGLYTTNLNIGDVVSMQLFSSPANLGKQISITRRDYTTDDQGSDNGIRDTFITTISGTTFPLSLVFTATTTSDTYNFEYRVTSTTYNVGPTPTPTPTLTTTPTPTATPTPTPTPTPFVIPSNCELNLDAGDPLSYPTTGITWYDLSGSGRTATLENGATYSSSNGGSIVFDGLNQAVRILRNGLTFGSNFTWNMWFKTNKTTDNQRIFANWSTAAAYAPFVFVWQINAGKLDGQIRNVGDFNMLPSLTATTISANTIYNLVVTWDAPIQTAKIYLNGTLIQTKLALTPGNVNIKVPTSTFMTLANSDADDYLDGNIYNIQAYSKTLTESEVSGIYSFYVTRYS
jgi:hypothetical protein